MKKLNLFSRMCSPRVGSQKDEGSSRLRVVFDSFTCRLRVCPLKLVSVLAILLTIGVGNVWGADVVVYSTGFESCSTGTDYKSTQTYSGTSDGTSTASWKIYYGTVSATGPITGSNSAQMRIYKNDANLGYLEQTSSISNVDSIRFNYKVTNTNVVFKVEYSTNDGGSWSNLQTNITCASTNTVYTFKHKLETRAAKFRIKISITGGTHSTNTARQFIVDDIVYKTVSSCSSPASALAVSAAETTIFAGSKTQLSTMGGNGSTVTYTVTSANSTYASIDGDNKFSASRPGTYTVQASQDDNSGTCGGTATVDITVRYQVKWSVNGDDTYDAGSPTTYIGTHNTKVSALPTDPTPSMCDGVKRFVGWTTSSDYSHASTPPGTLFRTASAAPNVTGNVTYYAVFANVTDSTATYDLISTTGDLETGKQYVIGHKTSGGSYYYMPNAAASSNPTLSTMTITGTQITSTVSNGMLWTLRSSGVTGYGYKWESVASSTNYLATSSGTGTVIRVGAAATYDKNAWDITTDGTYGWVLKSNGTYTSGGNTKTGKFAVIYDATTWRVYSDKSTNALSGAKFVIFKKNFTYTYANYDVICVEDKCVTPTFGKTAGTYIGTQSVTISCATTGATIYYTTDGSDPDESSNVYESALSITDTTTVKALAVKSGLTDSEVASATYNIRACKEYSLVTDASALGIGDKIVILDNSGTYAMSTTQNTKNRGVTTDFVLNSSTVRVPDVGEVQPITLEAYADGYWYFKVGDDSYLAATGTSEAQLKSQTKSTVNTNSTGKWSIALVSSVFTVKTNDGKTYNTMRYNYNSGSPIFNCYDGDKQTAIKVYAYQNTSPTIETNTASLSGFSATYGGSASDAQNVYVSGRNLNGNITVTPPIGYEIKKSGDAEYSSSAITLTPSSKKVSVTLNVRLAAGNNAGDYEGNLTLVGYNSEASTNVALTGTVAKMTPVITFTLDETAALANTAVGYTLSSTSSATALTFSYKRGGSAVSSMITNDTENKTISISQAGTYTIQVNQAGDDNHNAAAQAEQVLTITMRDVFKDIVNGYSDINGDDTGLGITTPTFAEMESGAQNTCNSTTRYLIGWIKASDLTTIYSGETGYLEDAAKYEANKAKLVAPGAETTATGVTWYAVWGEEK